MSSSAVDKICKTSRCCRVVRSRLTCVFCSVLVFPPSHLLYCLPVFDSRQVTASLCWLAVSFVPSSPRFPRPHPDTHSTPRASRSCRVYLSRRLWQRCELFVLPASPPALQTEFFSSLEPIGSPAPIVPASVPLCFLCGSLNAILCRSCLVFWQKAEH